MGCSTCKSKRNQKKDTKKVKNVTFENVEGGNNESPNKDLGANILSGLSEIGPQNFFLKLITFVAVVVALPLLSIYLIGYIFKMFFFTRNGDSGLSFNTLFKVLTYPKTKWKSIRKNIKEKARQREFDKNRGYSEESDLTDVDVFTSEEIKQKREYTGEKELEGVELLETTNKDNDNE